MASVRTHGEQPAVELLYQSMGRSCQCRASSLLGIVDSYLHLLCSCVVADLQFAFFTSSLHNRCRPEETIEHHVLRLQLRPVILSS
jgi:hypothetical protein